MLKHNLRAVLLTLRREVALGKLTLGVKLCAGKLALRRKPHAEREEYPQETSRGA